MADLTDEVQIADLLIIVYGSAENDSCDEDIRFCGEDQRRVEIRFKPRVPPEIIGNMRRIQTWVQDTVRSLAVDVKHSQKWHCEFCTKLARESSMSIMAWTHLSPPSINVYMHQICDTQRGRCSLYLKGIRDDMARMNAGTAPLMICPERNGGRTPPFAAAASCATCKKDETIIKSVFRCSKCKLTRYCSVDCQKQDWQRHKGTCKIVKEAKWVWN